MKVYNSCNTPFFGKIDSQFLKLPLPLQNRISSWKHLQYTMCNLFRGAVRTQVNISGGALLNIGNGFEQK